MSILGIYFGTNVISIAETEAKRCLKNISMPQLKQSSGAFEEEKVPYELKAATVIKEGLRNHNINATEAAIVLPGKDLIVRSFFMPLLPASELYNAVKFEARKYIPFKVEELIYDYQAQADRMSRRNDVLFVGIKRDVLDHYLSVLSQINIKAVSIEYAGFSLLRLLQLAGVSDRGPVAIITVDLQENDEVNFLVMENNYPLFNRDILLTGESPLETVMIAPTDMGQSMEKLKIELRMSFDFYIRKFPTKNIKTVILIAAEQHRQDLESFVKERSLNVRFVDSRRLVDRSVPYSLSFLKAYSGSLSKLIKSPVKIDLLPSKIKAKTQHLVQVPGGGGLKAFKPNYHLLLLALGIAFLPQLVFFASSAPKIKEYKRIIAERPQVPGIAPTANYNDLVKKVSDFRARINTVTDMVNKRLVLTEKLDSIPRIIPDGIWLRELTFRKTDKETIFTMIGSCYLGDGDQEIQLLNTFLADLKANPNFTRNFKAIELKTFDRVLLEKVSVLNFIIECRS